MTKQLNGIFRTWAMVRQPGENAPPIIWGHCVVHLSQPKFSGNVLHTSGVLDIVEYRAFKIVETRNNHYALLGPELVLPADARGDPAAYILQHRDPEPDLDSYASAAMTARRGCPKCLGTGAYHRDDKHVAICDLCCRHNQGWWQLEGAYGLDNGRWACKAGCGFVVDKPSPELEFLPRARL